MSDPTDETSAPDDAHQEPANPTMTVEPPGAEAPASRRDWPMGFLILGRETILAVATPIMMPTVPTRNWLTLA